jgi:LemA protein
MNRRRVLLTAILALSLLPSGCGYNTLQAQQQNIRGRWADLESQLQRRADLIPNLVEAAKMAGIQEQEVFGQIAQARSQLMQASNAAPQGEGGDKTPEQRQAVIEANSSLGSALGRLLVISENYPQLRSSESFMKLQDSIEGTENRINTSRQDYNSAVQEYNTTRGRFPTLLSAKLFGFKEEPYFKADEGARQAPRINAESLRRQ